MEVGVENHSTRRTGVSWSSVFAGTFVFLAIEITFSMLAAAIFAPVHANSGLGTGPGIWMIVLSIIALYFGGKTAAHFSGEARKLNGMYYGLTTFGLSIFTTIVIATMIAGNAIPSTQVGHGALTVVAANAVWLFVSLILGGIAGGIGGTLGVPNSASASAGTERASLRPAA